MKGLLNALLPLALVGALAPAATGQVSALVAHWDFAETSGTTLADGSGNGLDLTLSGGVVLGSAGAHASTGSAAEFDANTQGLGRVANQVPLSGMRDNFSVAAWVRVEPGGPSAIRRIFGCGGAGWSCGVTANGYRFTTKGIQDFDLGVAYPQSTWFHYAVVFDGAHDAHFYLDGAHVGTVNGGGPSNAPSGDWLLGSWNGTVEFWHGAMDDVQVYEGSLTAAEVAFLHQNPGSTVSPAQGQIFCAGDGSASSCPCGNLGASDEGCGNSTGLGGHLGAFGTLSMAAGNLELLGERLPPGQTAILFGGFSTLNSGNGVLFGDGLRCAGDPVQRLGVRPIDAAGSARWLGPAVAAMGGWQAGQTWRLQVWYSDVLGSPCGLGFNTSQGLELVLTP